VEFEEGRPEEVLTTHEEIEIYITQDSGAVAHIGPKEAMPSGVGIKPYPDGVNRNMVAANGGSIENYGTADVELMTEDGLAIGTTFMVADVTRPLHATGPICDTGKEVLYMSQGCVVVPKGTLSKYLKQTRILAKYPRRNGLYQGKFKIRVPRPKTNDGKPGFIRQGDKR
jgi:hypothetical protein